MPLVRGPSQYPMDLLPGNALPRAPFRLVRQFPTHESCVGLAEIPVDSASRVFARFRAAPGTTSPESAQLPQFSVPGVRKLLAPQIATRGSVGSFGRRFGALLAPGARMPAENRAAVAAGPQVRRPGAASARTRSRSPSPRTGVISAPAWRRVRTNALTLPLPTAGGIIGAFHGGQASGAPQSPRVSITSESRRSSPALTAEPLVTGADSADSGTSSAPAAPCGG